jgi:hypothetical protein
MTVNFYNATFRSPDSLFPSLFTPPESRPGPDPRYTPAEPLPASESSNYPLHDLDHQPPATMLQQHSKKPADICCGPSLLACVESDYSVRGFDAVAAETVPKAETVTVSAEDITGSVKVRQQGIYSTSPVNDEQRSKSAGLRSLPAFVAQTSEEKLRLGNSLLMTREASSFRGHRTQETFAEANTANGEVSHMRQEGGMPHRKTSLFEEPPADFTGFPSESRHRERQLPRKSCLLM